MRRIKEAFIVGEHGQLVTETLAVAKPDLPGLARRRRTDLNLAGIGRCRFDRLSTKTARAKSDCHISLPILFMGTGSRSSHSNSGYDASSSLQF
jgi:hypothetical protein